MRLTDKKVIVNIISISGIQMGGYERGWHFFKIILAPVRPSNLEYRTAWLLSRRPCDDRSYGRYDSEKPLCGEPTVETARKDNKEDVHIINISISSRA